MPCAVWGCLEGLRLRTALAQSDPWVRVCLIGRAAFSAAAIDQILQEGVDLYQRHHAPTDAGDVEHEEPSVGVLARFDGSVARLSRCCGCGSRRCSPAVLPMHLRSRPLRPPLRMPRRWCWRSRPLCAQPAAHASATLTLSEQVERVAELLRRPAAQLPRDTDWAIVVTGALMSVALLASPARHLLALFDSHANLREHLRDLGPQAGAATVWFASEAELAGFLVERLLQYVSDSLDYNCRQFVYLKPGVAWSPSRA